MSNSGSRKSWLRYPPTQNMYWLSWWLPMNKEKVSFICVTMFVEMVCIYSHYTIFGLKWKLSDCQVKSKAAPLWWVPVLRNSWKPCPVSLSCSINVQKHLQPWMVCQHLQWADECLCPQVNGRGAKEAQRDSKLSVSPSPSNASSNGSLVTPPSNTPPEVKPPRGHFAAHRSLKIQMFL